MKEGYRVKDEGSKMPIRIGSFEWHGPVLSLADMYPQKIDGLGRLRGNGGLTKEQPLARVASHAKKKPCSFCGDPEGIPDYKIPPGNFSGDVEPCPVCWRLKGREFVNQRKRQCFMRGDC